MEFDDGKGFGKDQVEARAPSKKESLIAATQPCMMFAAFPDRENTGNKARGGGEVNSSG